MTVESFESKNTWLLKENVYFLLFTKMYTKTILSQWLEKHNTKGNKNKDTLNVWQLILVHLTLNICK